jgi:hypothetical protein
MADGLGLFPVHVPMMAATTNWPRDSTPSDAQSGDQFVPVACGQHSVYERILVL